MIDRYEPIYASFWATVRHLDAEAKLVTTFLRTCPQATAIPGVIVGGVASFADELGMDPGTFRDAVDRAIAAGAPFQIDHVARVVFFPGEVERRPPENPGQVKGWSRAWSLISPCPIKAEIHSRLRVACARHLGGKINRDECLPTDFDRVFPPVPETVCQTVPQTVRGTKTRQDTTTHEQVHEQETPAPGGAVSRGKGARKSSVEAPIVELIKNTAKDANGQPVFVPSRGWERARLRELVSHYGPLEIRGRVERLIASPVASLAEIVNALQRTTAAPTRKGPAAVGPAAPSTDFGIDEIDPREVA